MKKQVNCCKLIESGATVYVNRDIALGRGGAGEAITIDNFGNITTEITSEPYPKIDGDTTINNHENVSIEEVTDSTTASTIKTNNTVEGKELKKVYKIKEEAAGSIDPKITIGEGVTVVSEFPEVLVTNLAYTANDVLYLEAGGADKTVRLRGNQDATCPFINCNLGDQGATNSYNLEIVEVINIGGDETIQKFV